MATPRKSVFKAGWRGWLAGALVVTGTLGWTWISGDFVYGEGHAERPIPLFLCFYAISWVGLFLAWRVVSSGAFLSTRTVLLVALLARLVLIPSQLIQENDVYRYVLDGQVMLAGGNPYAFSPMQLAEGADSALSQKLKDPGAQLVLSRIGYSDVPTVYPPAAQFAFAAGAWLGGWDWRGQRAFFMAVDALLVLLLIILLIRLSAQPSWVVLYAWNPLILKEVMNSAHVDVLVALTLVLMLFGLNAKASRFWAPVGSAGLFLGVGVTTKWLPLLLAPAVSLYLWRRRGPIAGLVFAIVVLLVSVGLWLPFSAVGWGQMMSGLSTYSRFWTMNEGAFWLLAQLGDASRLLAGAVVAIAALGLPWLNRDRSPGSLSGCMFWIYLWWLLWTPAVFPWYAVPLVALAVLSGDRAVANVSVLLSGVLSLYYVTFLVEYRELSSWWWTVARLVEHGAIWIALIFALRQWPWVKRKLPA